MEPATLPLFARQGEPIRGVFSVERVTFSNPETGYAVVQLVPADESSSLIFTAVGIFGDPRSGECYRIEGLWDSASKYGLQVRVSAASRETPHSLAAIERYLAGASIKGLGPHFARALVKHFGEETFEELERGGPHLEEVSGIGPVRARTIRESWAEHRGIHDLMVNLQGLAGLTPGQAQRVFQQYGMKAWDMVSRDPYSLAEEVRGFGFRTCDRIGRALGIADDAPQRIQAGVVHLLNQALADGHLWSSADEVIGDASRLLDVAPEAVSPQLGALVNQGRLVQEEVPGEPPVSSLWLPRVARAEQTIADRLAHLLGAPVQDESVLSEVEARDMTIRLGHPDSTEEQRQAVVRVLAGARVVILTGGPGTGKTTTVRSLIACLEALHVSYALCATTGRASKQLASLTGREAATVHRHLGIGIGRGKIEPVRESVLVIDESSMIDIWLLREILSRTTERTRLFLVGDVDQIPSVGPGAVLQDLISAAERAHLPGVHVTRLTHIFRQEAGDRSIVVINCHRVRAGHRPIRDVPRTSDYFEMYRDTPEEARELAVSLASTRLPSFLNVPALEVQVLAPMHAGEAGIRALNQALQQALNPSAPTRAEIVLAGAGRGAEHRRVLREGDKVRQTRNNYKKRVFNGDLGIISRIYLAERRLVVRFDDHAVTYDFGELDELVHAWAMTVHAAQGSQWPAVVIIMLKNHYVMLERNILYTALSRAQRMVVLVTQEQAVRIAVAQDRSTQRRTNLLGRLQTRFRNGEQGRLPRAAPPTAARQA